MNKRTAILFALIFSLFLTACQQQPQVVKNEPEVQTNGKMTKTFSAEEAAAHSTYQDCWLIIDNKVYDVTDYIADHPGEETILEGCGIDATSLYENRPMGSGTPHSEEARKAMEKYFIGEIKGTGTTDTAAAINTDSKSTGESYDPCELLTEQDVIEKFPGKTASITTHDTKANAVGQKICFYSLSDEDMIFAQLSFTNEADMNENVKAGGQNAEVLFAGVKEFVENITPVSGLGSEAYYGGSGLTPGAGLNVLDKEKGIFFTITVGLGFGNSDEDTHLQIEKDLAEKILSRI